MFALRHKGTAANFMPNYKGRAGGTYIDPADPSTHTGTPRIFTTALAAKNALRWWANGHAKATYSAGDPFDVLGGPEFDGIKQEKVAGRSADDWEVVEVALVVLP